MNKFAHHRVTEGLINGIDRKWQISWKDIQVFPISIMPQNSNDIPLLLIVIQDHFYIGHFYFLKQLCAADGK
ncbi:hypothetical protein D3C86_2110640 [compost metagenome]